MIKRKYVVIKNHNRIDEDFKAYWAIDFWTRFMGLMGKKSLPEKTGLFFPNCSSIHCFFMKITIDVIYLDKNYTVLFKESVKPWKVGSIVKNTKHILELREHGGDNIEIGDKITWTKM